MSEEIKPQNCFCVKHLVGRCMVVALWLMFIYLYVFTIFFGVFGWDVHPEFTAR